MNVRALRRALHAAADLIADALEEDAASPAKPTPKRPKTRRGPAAPAPIPPSMSTPEERERALAQARRNGVL